MSHLHLVEPGKPPKPRRALKRVRELLADVSDAAENHRYTDCVVLMLDKQGNLSVDFVGEPVRLIGLLEVAKLDILDNAYPIDGA